MAAHGSHMCVCEHAEAPAQAASHGEEQHGLARGEERVGGGSWEAVRWCAGGGERSLSTRHSECGRIGRTAEIGKAGRQRLQCRQRAETCGVATRQSRRSLILPGLQRWVVPWRTATGRISTSRCGRSRRLRWCLRRHLPRRIRVLQMQTIESKL